MAHYSGNVPSLFFSICFDACTFLSSSHLSLSCYQAVQLTRILDKRLKELVEDAEQEKALKDVAVAMAKEKGKAAEVAEKRAQSVEKARLVAKKKLTKVEVKLGNAELKLAEVDYLNLT